LGGILTLDSDWNPPLGQPLLEALAARQDEGVLYIGCVAAGGAFWTDERGGMTVTSQSKPATALLFELIARLQAAGTVPMIDVRAYAKWLAN
jgi:hypothetical protein